MAIRPPTVQERIKQWIERNPTRWYTAFYEDIKVEAGVSVHSLYRYYPLLVAKVAGILPSEVKAKRWQEGGFKPLTPLLSDAEIALIQRLFNEGHDLMDIKFMTGRSFVQIARHDPDKKSGKAKKTDTTDENGTA